MQNIPTAQVIGSTIDHLFWFALGAYVAWIRPRRLRREVLASKISDRECQAKLKQFSPLITTVPLNKSVSNGKGLPPVDASADEVYKAAERLSQFREAISIPSDGVYCPICHIANIQLSKLRTPCPKCGRALLKFGWD